MKADEGSWSSENFDYAVGAGYLGKWDTSSLQADGVYYVRLVDQIATERYTQIRLDRDIKKGYPVFLSPLNASGQFDSNEIHSKIGNVDPSGGLQIVTLRSYDEWAQVYVFNSDGLS
jgi:hypothetical protein